MRLLRGGIREECFPSNFKFSILSQAFSLHSSSNCHIGFYYQMLPASKLLINAATSAQTSTSAPKIEKIRQSMTVPVEARKLKILCLHGYLQNAEVRNII
jgi:hypothetical protein